MSASYEEFLSNKSAAAPIAGFDLGAFTAPLFPFQRDIVTMACRVGKFCIWADCGMGKSHAARMMAKEQELNESEEDPFADD